VEGETGGHKEHRAVKTGMGTTNRGVRAEERLLKNHAGILRGKLVDDGQKSRC